ncbi:hypothetical protein PQR67_15210 [Paraburkholderia fungorum]|uniref:hypothetical protein n=1 Tax=Paraburkholderia fungorum TaxID=134537 RepID=UPI0038BD2D67
MKEPDSSQVILCGPGNAWAFVRIAVKAYLVMQIALFCQMSFAQDTKPLMNKVTAVKPKVANAPAALAVLQLEWHKSLINTPVPHEGCFQAEYPKLGWREVTCAKPPDIPMPPRQGALPDTVGNGYDYSAQVSGKLISVIGSFSTANTTGENGYTYQSPSTQVANAYTLQINSNFFASPPACTGTANPGSCQGWQQYVYSSKSGGSAYIQYWLINYGNSCPSGWIQYQGSCFRNSSQAVTVTLIPATSLAQTNMTGSVAAGGNDRLDLASGATHYVMTSPDNMLGLADYWTTAEFAVVGDCCGYSANFNAGTALAVTTTVHNSTTGAPSCVLEGFTGETNNLNMVNTPPIPTQAAPTLLSDQSSASSSAAACAVASGIADTHLHTFTPTPQAVNGPASNLNYDFQAQGEFVLALTDMGFQVQTRQISGAPQWPNAAVNQAIAASIGKTVVVFSVAGNKPQVFANGSPVVLRDGEKRVFAGDGDLTRHGNAYVARDMHGNSVQAILQSAPTDYIDVYVGLGRWPANVQGLLVNAKGNVNAVVARDGKVIPAPFNFGTFYSAYGDSWRVPANQSLFDAGRLSLAALTDSNPVQPFYAADLAPAVYSKSREQCVAAGVKPQNLEDCALDVAVIGDKHVALSHVNARIPVSGFRGAIFTEEAAKSLVNK